MSLEALESKKDDVLNETVAQDIFRELKDLRAYVDTHGKRWVLELIQNALDASKENGVDVKINFDGSTLLFSHNGRAFTEEELIHLIYHGSTKLDSEGTSGKLGTGFLASHLLSPRVNVKGTLRDMQGFKFILDRDADGVKQLTDKMKDTWDQLRKSLHPVENNNGLDTSYEYHIETPEQADIYRKGISILIETAPIILAFDKRLRSISIKEAGGEFVWSAKESSNSSLIDINLIHNGIPEESKICSLIVVRRDKTSVAVPLTRKNGMLSVLNTIDIPKLYYPLPLIGSNGFPSPFLISNSGFVPTKDREGALLTSGIKEEDVKGNRQIIETAFGILDEFFELLSKGGYGDLHNVARLPELEKVRSNYSKWLDETWMEQLVRTLIEKIRSRSVLSTENGTIPPKDSKIPILVGIQDGPNRQEKLKKMWALAAKVFPKSTPTEEYAETWEEILSEWLAHQSSEEQQSEPFAEVLTIEKLSKIAEENGNLNDLQSSIEGSSAIEWLNDLLTLIQMLKKDTLFDEQRILSDQNGIFRTRKGLYRDSEISEELKDIATMLGYYVRTELLMNGVVSAALTNSRTEKEILLETLKRIKDQSKADHQKENYQKANVKLFQWLIEGKKFEEIRESFPVLTHGKDIGEGDYLYSFSAENKFLTPEAIWKEENKKHIDVFPPRAILSNIYSNLGQECWSLLEESNLVFQNLSFAQAVLLSDKQVRALSFEEINESDDGDHKSKDRVHVSTVPFLEDKDWGVMDRISGKERAARFLSFILDNLIKNDASWKKPTTVACSCGSTHQIYPSVWLEALRTRQWVPVSGGKGEKPSSENLAPFFAQNELARLLGDDDATHFLGILGVNV
ncbi:MAG: ATP-binding protein, partial [Thaumarchaeota archaeon]|nr:ATP-binding protein [Nitrososphaerota archaeon]